MLFTKNKIIKGKYLFPLFIFFLLIGCGENDTPKPKGDYLLTKGQAIREVKLRYGDLIQYHECSKPPEQICSEKDIFVVGENNNEYDMIFREGSGGIHNISPEKKVFYLSDYYYFTVTKTTGEVNKKGAFEKKLNLSGNYDFTCKGQTFWNIPVTTDCSNSN